MDASKPVCIYLSILRVVCVCVPKVLWGFPWPRETSRWEGKFGGGHCTKNPTCYSGQVSSFAPPSKSFQARPTPFRWLSLPAAVSLYTVRIASRRWLTGSFWGLGEGCMYTWVDHICSTFYSTLGPSMHLNKEIQSADIFLYLCTEGSNGLVNFQY